MPFLSIIQIFKKMDSNNGDQVQVQQTSNNQKVAQNSVQQGRRSNGHYQNGKNQKNSQKSRCNKKIQALMQHKRILGKMVNRKFKICQVLGGGTFSSVYKCISLQTHQKLAFKLTNDQDENGFLRKQKKFYMKARQLQGFPRFYAQGTVQDRHFIVLEKLSDSLETVFLKCQKKFTIKTILNLGIEAIKLLEKVHQLGYIYRDVKPANFLLGHKNRKDKIYLIDFGLVKPYLKRSKRHISMKKNKCFVGTPRFASVASHEGKQQGRKDDLQSLGYMLIYFLKGRLPWQGLQKNSDEERVRCVGKIKKSMDLEQLCQYKSRQYNINFNGETFVKYFSYLRTLAFQDQPNYDFLKKLFRRQIEQIEEMDISILGENNKWKSLYYFDWLCERQEDIQLLRSDNANGRVRIIINGNSIAGSRKNSVENRRQQNRKKQNPDFIQFRNGNGKYQRSRNKGYIDLEGE